MIHRLEQVLLGDHSLIWAGQAFLNWQWQWTTGVELILGSKFQCIVLFWNLHSRGERGRKGRERKFKNKAHSIIGPRNHLNTVYKCFTRLVLDIWWISHLSEPPPPRCKFLCQWVHLLLLRKLQHQGFYNTIIFPCCFWNSHYWWAQGWAGKNASYLFYVSYVNLEIW